MEVRIFDVEHGSCATVISPNGHLLMIDCGHNDTTGWRPWAWVAVRGGPIANLTITNFDQDHVTDLPNVIARNAVTSWTMNWDVTPQWVRQRKGVPGMSAGVECAVRQLEATRRLPGFPHATGVSIDWGAGFDICRFWHPLTAMADENYLSVVTFIHCGTIRIVFPGDLTAIGWQDFLANPQFRGYLQNTNIFVASHHGREDGYCPEVFRYCKPDVILASDKSVMYGTQIVDYGQHARGILWTTNTGKQVQRSFLTTRNDGTLGIAPRASTYYIHASG
jgi:beta-lactamase superfamily II metal-dependent hydrolase